MNAISGTQEWAVKNVNCLVGCSHDCRYCYARANMLRFGRIKSAKEWARPKLRDAEVKKGRRRVAGTVMFPSSHDILPEFLEPCLMVIRKLLQAHNQLLIVSKPHWDCIEPICNLTDARCLAFVPAIRFRFTIGALDDELLGYWEPGAPTLIERLFCLQKVHRRGFRTSISAEPLLDAQRVLELVDAIDPYVTETIWIGTMNQIDQRVLTGTKRTAIARIKAGQTPDRIREVYEQLKDNPKIRWKESYKRVLGLPLAQKPGLDI